MDDLTPATAGAGRASTKRAARRGAPAYNDNTLVVGYYRYSSASQNEASIEQQRELVHRWAKAQGLQVVREYADAAKTGTNADRPEFQLMLRELPSVRPAYVAVWKNDRLGRNRADLLRVKQAIRMAGARLKYIEGFSPTDDPDSILVEGMSDAFAEYYSRQLSANIRRGVAYNAQNALANGRKIYGYRIDAEKKYQRDDVTGPIVESIFADYVAGKTSQAIADDLNASGARTLRGFEFTPKTLQKMLKHRAYIGEYAYAGHVIPGGMPALVSDQLFEDAQRKLAANRSRGAKTKAQLAAGGSASPDYWLTGVMYCEMCGGPLEGVSGTSKTGAKHRYYYCLNQRKKTCTLSPLRKDDIESRVMEVIETFLDDSEALASLAVDLAAEYRKSRGRGDELLLSLEAQRQDVEKQLANFVKAIGMGVFNETTAKAMAELEERKRDLEAGIQAERVKVALLQDESSIGAFFARYAHAKMDDPATRAMLLEYFVDKVFVNPTTLTVASWFYDHGEPITWEQLQEAKATQSHVELVREFDMGPWGGPP